MKRILFILILLNLSAGEAFSRSYKLKVTNYYTLGSDLETSISKWDGENLNLVIDEVEDSGRFAYPLGTEFIGKVVEKKLAKRFYRDEYLMVQIDKVKFPDGCVEDENMRLKLHPRPFLFNKERIGTTIIDIAAFTLGTVFDSTVVGLPVSRGSYAVFYSYMEIHNRPVDSSRMKAGIIGFSKGLIFPIPQLLAKGHNLHGMKVGSRISLDREKKGKSIDAYLRKSARA